MLKSLNDWASEAHGTAISKGFYDRHGALMGEVAAPALAAHLDRIWKVSRLALIATEVSEAIECVRKNQEADLPSELADIFLRLADFAGACGIDLEAAVCTKHAHNQERDHMHGKAL